MSDADSHLRNHHIATLCAERDAAIARAEAAEFNFRAALARAEEAEHRAAALTAAIAQATEAYRQSRPVLAILCDAENEGKAALATARAEGAREATERAANWLRRNANAEKDPKMRAAFIEAHNGIRAGGGQDA